MPLPNTVAVRGVEIERDGGVLVDADDEGVRRQHLLHLRQSTFAQVAEPGVVVAALGVVVVRDHHDRQAGHLPDEVEPLGPGRWLARLVDLVHRHRVRAEGERGGAGEDDHAAALEPIGEQLRDLGVAPLPQRVGRAARTGEDPAGVARGRRAPGRGRPGEVATRATTPR